MYFLMNDQFAYQKINKKSLFRLKLVQKLGFLKILIMIFSIILQNLQKSLFDSLVSMPRKKQTPFFFLEVTKFETFDEKRNSSPKIT
jgi:hypothetical protein